MTLRKILALICCAVMLTACASGIAEETAAELSDESVIAVINGEDLTWLDVRPWYNTIAANYGAYNDEEWLRAAGLENAIYERILLQKGKELGLDEWTDEEAQQALELAQSTWAEAIANYVANIGSITETSTDEEKEAANQEAEAYYVSAGYSVELLADWERINKIINNVQMYMEDNCTVSDEEVTAEYDKRIASDKELYGMDVTGYEYAKQMAQYYPNYGFEMPLYQPAGFRSVKHIFMYVDTELMNDYTGKLARLEEQMDEDVSQAQSGEDTHTSTDEGTEPAETQEPPVTQADVDAAKQAILDSIKDKITDIQTRIAAGEDFDALVKEYGEDEGMKVEPMMTSGYSVHMDSTTYDPSFVQGSFSVENIGDVSEPVVSSMGVHIIKYVGDVMEGPVALTDDLKASIADALKSMKIEALYESWLSGSEITFTGLITPMSELTAQE